MKRTPKKKRERIKRSFVCFPRLSGVGFVALPPCTTEHCACACLPCPSKEAKPTPQPSHLTAAETRRGQCTPGRPLARWKPPFPQYLHPLTTPVRPPCTRLHLAGCRARRSDALVENEDATNVLVGAARAEQVAARGDEDKASLLKLVEQQREHHCAHGCGRGLELHGRTGGNGQQQSIKDERTPRCRSDQIHIVATPTPATCDAMVTPQTPAFLPPAYRSWECASRPPTCSSAPQRWRPPGTTLRSGETKKKEIKQTMDWGKGIGAPHRRV